MDQEFDINLEQMIIENKSFIMGQSSIKFLQHNLVVDGKGVKKYSENGNVIFQKVQIDSSRIKEGKIIGRGAAGEVKFATYMADHGEVPIAIKSIPADQKQKRKQLLNDLKTFLSSNNCEYLVKFYGCFFQHGFVKQIIQFMNLGSLRDVINFVRKTGLKPSQKVIATITLKILKGLQYIHRVKHQIHRDIKPQNILVNSYGQIKITDFGITKYLQMTHNFASTFIGSTIYMSPQRVGNKEYSYNCDVWSLGLVIYQLATGLELPYIIRRDESVFKLLSKIMYSPAPELSKNQFSAQFCDFISKCLQKNNKERQGVQALLSHNWIQKNYDQNALGEFIQAYKTYMKDI